MRNNTPTTPSTPTPHQRLLTVAEVRERLGGRSRSLVFRLARKGLLTRVVIPGTTRAIGFTEQSVDEFIASCARQGEVLNSYDNCQ